MDVHPTFLPFGGAPCLGSALEAWLCKKRGGHGGYRGFMRYPIQTYIGIHRVLWGFIGLGVQFRARALPRVEGSGFREAGCWQGREHQMGNDMATGSLQ